MGSNRRSNILPHRDLQYKIVAQVLALAFLGMVLVGGSVYTIIWYKITSPEFASGQIQIIKVFDSVHTILFFIFPMSVALITWLGLVISHRIAGPLVRLDHGMRHISEGSLPNHPMKFRKGDEHHHLADRFNAMVEAVRERFDEEKQRADQMKRELETLSKARERLKAPAKPAPIAKAGKKTAVSKGFTLIELMIVVVIIGILAAIAIPNFLSMRTRAQEASLKHNMHTLQLVVEDFATQTEGVYPGSIDVKVCDIITTGADCSIAEGARIPPFPPQALLCPHASYTNPIFPKNMSIDDLAGGPPARPEPGNVFYTGYDGSGNAITPGTSAAGYTICSYGRSTPMPFVIVAGR